MVVADDDLRGLVEKMAFGTEDARRPFQLDNQIQPASIDLRLGSVFWQPKASRSRRKLDLREPIQDNRVVERMFERRVCKTGDGVELPPGGLILGRVYESFQVPTDHIALIHGRSSFARLGLSVHCTGDFINPGWKGHMPLQLVNHGRVPLILTPYVHICQLVLVRLTRCAAKPYGAPGLGSRYMDDQGGPSRYWEESRLKKLQKAIGGKDLPDRVQAEFKESSRRGRSRYPRPLRRVRRPISPGRHHERPRRVGGVRQA